MKIIYYPDERGHVGLYGRYYWGRWLVTSRVSLYHVASTDPIRDALFLRKWLKHEPLTDFPRFCDEREAWVALP